MTIFLLTYQLRSLHLVFIRYSDDSKDKIDKIEATKQYYAKEIKYRPWANGIQDLRKQMDTL